MIKICDFKGNLNEINNYIALLSERKEELINLAHWTRRPDTHFILQASGVSGVVGFNIIKIETFYHAGGFGEKLVTS